MSKNFYQILAVSPTSSEKEIRDSFFKLSLINHPEKNNLSKESKKKFREIQESFENLIKDYNKNYSFFPVEKNKLIRLKVLTNKLDEINAEKEEEELKKENELLKNNSKELEELKVAFLKIYKNGSSATKYKSLELEQMTHILELIKNKEPNKKLDGVFQGYKDELENKVLKPLAPWVVKVSMWFSLAVNSEERLIVATKENNDLLLDAQNALEEIEKIRYLSPVEADQLKKIKEFDKNEDLTPLEVDLDEDKKDDEDRDGNLPENYENWTYEQLIKGIKKLNQEIEELKADKNIRNSEKQIKLANLTEKLGKLVEKKGKTNEDKNQKSDNKFPTGWVVGAGILVITGIIVLFIIKSKKRKRKQLN